NKIVNNNKRINNQRVDNERIDDNEYVDDIKGMIYRRVDIERVDNERVNNKRVDDRRANDKRINNNKRMDSKKIDNKDMNDKRINADENVDERIVYKRVNKKMKKAMRIELSEEDNHEIRPTKRYKLSTTSSLDKCPESTLQDKTNVKQILVHKLYLSIASKPLEQYHDDMKLQLNKCNKRLFDNYNVGSLVHLKIPEIDRTHSD
ncbi:3570_t:CDS:2, partial [Dentiscutata erythropus]